MNQTINIYCDESCHLEHDRQKVMVLGAVWSPTSEAYAISCALRQLKASHQLSRGFELKWGKVSNGKAAYYQGVMDYFFNDTDLHFRALIVPEKSKLRPDAFSPDHDSWYYRMYLNLIQALLSPKGRYRIYLDKKETSSGQKVARLHQSLCDDLFDFDRRIIERVQIVTSNDVEQVQLCDFLTGAISYANRGLTLNPAKVALLAKMRMRSGYSLVQTTLPGEEKMNLFHWRAEGV